MLIWGMLGVAGVAWAESDAPVSSRDGRGEPAPWEGDEEPTADALRDAGWSFLDEDTRPGQALAGLLAGTVGAAAHGVGHLVIGDEQTALRLFILQGAAMAAFVTGVAVRSAAPGSAFVVGASEAVAVTAGGVFMATWAGDMVGAFRGTATPAVFPPLVPDGVVAEAAFTRVFAQGLPVRDLAVVGIPMRFGRLGVVPEVEADPRLRYRRLSLGVGWERLFPDGLSSVEGRLIGVDEWTRPAAAGRAQGGVEGVLRLDGGVVAPHLSGLVWEHRLAVMADGLALGSAWDGWRFRQDTVRWHAPVETAVELAVNPVVHLTAGYRHRDDLLVGTLGDRAGVLWGRLGLVPRNRVGAEVMVEQGSFLRIWLRLRWVVREAR